MKINVKQYGKVWFIADTHFGHKNICEYSERSYDDVQEMDEEILKKINDVVKPKHLLIHLGDFSFGNTKDVSAYRGKIKCKHVWLVKGNHDKNVRKSHLGKVFERIFDGSVDCNIGNRLFTLSHYPYHTWNKSHYNAINLHGHNHGSLKPNKTKRRIDVGVDCFNMAPVSLTDILKIIKCIEEDIYKTKPSKKNMNYNRRLNEQFYSECVAKLTIGD